MGQCAIAGLVETEDRGQITLEEGAPNSGCIQEGGVSWWVDVKRKESKRKGIERSGEWTGGIVDE